MAVAEPASRATEKTIGGILLVAFIAASAGFYVHTTSATSEDSPMDMQPGYVYNSPTEQISMDRYGRGTLAPIDDAHRRQQRLASGATAINFHSSSQNAPGGPAAPSRQQSPAHNTHHAADQRQLAHLRLLNQQNQQLARSLAKQHLPGPVDSLQPSASAKLASKNAAEKMQASGAARALYRMEKRIVSDVVKAFKCTPGSRCIEKSLIDAEKTADRLVQRSSASSTAHRKAIGTVDAKQASPSNLRSKAVTGNPLNVLGPELPIADASSERFWQEAAHVAAAGSDKPQRKVPKNSAKAFVHDMISAAHRAANADPKDGTHAIATVAAGPMSETKVKTF